MEMESDAAKPPEEKPKGGLRTMPFIIANESFEKIASFGLQPNMILYLMGSYHFSAAGGTSALFIWGAINHFTPVLGAFLADSYFGRFLIICFASISTLMGLVVLWLTSIIKAARPPPCAHHLCPKPNSSQLALLFTAFGLMSIGAGGIRPCSIAFGADQFGNKGQRILQTYFSWYYASVGISLMVAVTIIVYIQNDFGWIVGFGVPVGLMLVSVIMFFSGYKLYIKIKPQKSLLTGLVQALVASWKNRHLDILADGRNYYHTKGSKFVVPTDDLRFLNKACILLNPEKDLKPDGSPSDPWSLCSVLQVEVLKSLIKLLPIWSTGIIIGVTISQHSFPVLQAGTLDRRVFGNSFKIPPGSFGLFAILALTIWVALYDRIVVPRLSKYTSNPRGIGVKTRLGIGLFISCLATAAAALVERTRRARALHEGLVDNPKAQVDMSAMWLIPQHGLTGLAEAFNAIAQIELYYSQFPKSMGSIAIALFALGLAIANLVGSLIVHVVNTLSRKGGRESWVCSNLNRGHYDYYYWVLTVLSVVNLFYFFMCNRSYRCCEKERVWDEDETGDEPLEVAMVDGQQSKDTPSFYLSA